MFDFLQTYIPTAIQYALAIYTINALMSFSDIGQFYESVAWYSIKCSTSLDRSCKSIKKFLKYSGIITNKHRIDFISNGKTEATVVLYQNDISKNTIRNTIRSLENYNGDNADLIMYISPVNDDTNKSDIIVSDSIDNITYPYVPAKKSNVFFNHFVARMCRRRFLCK